MVAHAERQDALVDSQTRSEENKVWRFLVDRFDDELAVVERYVSNFRPGETDLRSQPERVKRHAINSEPQKRS